jgi:hypothetical protein
MTFLLSAIALASCWKRFAMDDVDRSERMELAAGTRMPRSPTLYSRSL